MLFAFSRSKALIENKQTELLGYLSIIKDPRLDRKKLHSLQDILFIGVCAAIPAPKKNPEIIGDRGALS